MIPVGSESRHLSIHGDSTSGPRETLQVIDPMVSARSELPFLALQPEKSAKVAEGLSHVQFAQSQREKAKPCPGLLTQVNLEN